MSLEHDVLDYLARSGPALQVLEQFAQERHQVFAVFDLPGLAREAERVQQEARSLVEQRDRLLGQLRQQQVAP